MFSDLKKSLLKSGSLSLMDHLATEKRRRRNFEYFMTIYKAKMSAAGGNFGNLMLFVGGETYENREI